MTEYNAPARRRGGVLRIPRSRGALSGFLLIALGVWGALVPFVGPYFNYGYTQDTWAWTQGRLWLEVLPGAAAILGGLILLMTANRASAVFGGWLASVAGAWFVVGPIVSQLWGGDAANVGAPLGGTKRQVVEQLGFFSGLGVVVLFLAAHAAGRVTVRSVRDLEALERHADDEPVVVPEARRDEPLRTGRDAGTRDTAARDTAARDTGTGVTSTGTRPVGGRSGATPLAEEEPRRGSSSARERD